MELHRFLAGSGTTVLVFNIGDSDVRTIGHRGRGSCALDIPLHRRIPRNSEAVSGLEGIPPLGPRRPSVGMTYREGGRVGFAFDAVPKKRALKDPLTEVFPPIVEEADLVVTSGSPWR